jgi:hypothetical protein
MIRILIATPTYDGSVRKEYMRSFIELTSYLDLQKIEWELFLEPATLLHVMRSVMASKALAEGFTHILFIDADIGFAVSAVKKLINAKKAIIGCAYPYRTIPLHEDVKTKDISFMKAISQILPYAVKFAPETTTINVKNGICQVAGIGTGLLLISKEALQTMVDAKCVEKYKNSFPYNQWFKGDVYYGFFEHVSIDGVHLGEDYSFCHRWSKHCNGEIYAVIDEAIMHIGPLPVLGRYIDRIKSSGL